MTLLGTGAKWGIKAGAKANKVAETVKLGSKISTKGKGFAVSGGQTLEAVKNVYKYVVKAGETANWSDAVEYTKLGLKVASMGDLGASIAKNGPALKAMSRGQDVVEAAPISNATRRVASERGKATNTLTDAQKSRLNALDNTIEHNLKETDFSGTLRDLQGNPVPNPLGGYYDHLTEMKQSYISLNKIKKGLEGSLKNPNLSSIDRELLQNGLDKANAYIKRIEELFKPFGGI